MTVEYTYRDAGLRSRPLLLLNRVGARLQALGVDRPGLSADAVVAAARKKAGRDDLGSDSYREPLEHFVASALGEAELTTFGRLLVHRMLSGALVNRIALHQWSREHPEVHDQRVESPWIIVGLPRTGTSLLSMLLGLDPVARPLLHWEAAHPVPPPTLAEAGEDPRIAATAREIDGLFKLNPPLRAMHPFGATLAQECVALFMYDVRTLGLETQAHVPSYGRWLETADMTPAYAQHRLALQTFQTALPTQRWVLKSPNHLWCLGTMLATYPDARVIWTHRDPATVVTSLVSLVNATQAPLTSRTEPFTVAEEWKRKAKHALSTATAFDSSAPNDWCAHVHYDAFMADPVGTVRELYARHGEAVTELHERRMQAWLDQRGQDVFGRHRYDPADFGWTYAGLEDEFADYTTRYGITREHG